MTDLRMGNGKTAGVVGMGRSGAAAARLLASRGFAVTGFDSSAEASSVEHIQRTVFGEFSDQDLKWLSVLVLSPGVPPSSSISLRAADLGVPVIGEVELAWANTTADILAVTGSNGKTTTVEWLGHVIRSAGTGVNAITTGNIGYAFSDAILDHPLCPVFVLELSSYQLETVKNLRPLCAAILNLTPDHLTRHGSMENYGAAKARVFMNQRNSDTAILNFDDPLLEKYRRISCGRQMYFSMKEEVECGAWLTPSGMIVYKDEERAVEVLQAGELSIPGRHNIANALAVICMAASYGLPPEKLVAGLKSFSGVPHRIEFIGKAKGLNWVNDSKSTNADSLKVALESFERKVILLAGGQQKESDYSILNSLLRQKVKSIVLFGSGAETLLQQWRGTVEIVIVKNLEEAVSKALFLAENDDTVLLSPGCASFDQYLNFEERGEHFRQIVKALS
jgi:UDP-N-acetylmuramoylalanine--D-glutamate ligase